MSVDCQRLQDVTAFLYLTWSMPLTIAIALYQLWAILGRSLYQLPGIRMLWILGAGNGKCQQTHVDIAYTTPWCCTVSSAVGEGVTVHDVTMLYCIFQRLGRGLPYITSRCCSVSSGGGGGGGTVHDVTVLFCIFQR